MISDPSVYYSLFIQHSLILLVWKYFCWLVHWFFWHISVYLMFFLQFFKLFWSKFPIIFDWNDTFQFHIEIVFVYLEGWEGWGGGWINEYESIYIWLNKHLPPTVMWDEDISGCSFTVVPNSCAHKELLKHPYCANTYNLWSCVDRAIATGNFSHHVY